MNIRYKLKQSIALLLACLTATTSVPITSYAIGGNTGAGDQAGIVGGVGSDLGANRPASRIGFRVSIVSKDDPSKVISVNDNGDPTVIDFLFTDEANFQKYTGYSTSQDKKSDTAIRSKLTYLGKGSRLQDWNANNNVWILPEEKYLIEELADDQVPQWNYSAGSILFAGNGSAFRQWFIETPEGEVAAEDGIIWVAGGVTSSKRGQRVDVTTSYTDVNGNPVKFSVDIPSLETEEDIDKWVDQYAHNWDPAITAFARDELGITNWDSIDSDEKAMLYTDFINTQKSLVEDIAKSNEVVAENIDDIYARLDDVLKSMSSQIEGYESASILKKLNPFSSMTAYATEYNPADEMADYVDNPGGSETKSPEEELQDVVDIMNGQYGSVDKPQNPSLSDGIVDVDITEHGFTQLPKRARIFLLTTLPSTTKTGYLFQTEETIAKAEAGEKFENNSIYSGSTDFYVFVEPLFFCSMFPIGDDSQVLVNKFYGTLTNFYDCLQDKTNGIGKILGGSGSYYNKNVRTTMNWKFYNSAGSYGSIVLENDLLNSAGQIVLNKPTGLGATASFEDLYNALIRDKKGYAVHAYTKGQFGDSNMTYTWDYENYPDRVGPAPDESDNSESNWNYTLKTPDNPNPTDENLEKKFIISKFYYVKDALGNYTHTDTFTRLDTLHNVEITDEGTPDSDFVYRVVGWATGKDKLYPETGDLTHGFDWYTKQNRPADPSHQGNGQDTLKLDPQDPEDKQEQVLYVMLVRDKLKKDTIDIVRVYENEDGTSTVEEELEVDRTPTVDGTSPKPEYTFEESVTTPDPRKPVDNWTEVPTGTNGTTPQIPVKETEKTVYIHYTQTDDPEPNPSKLLLHENEISHQFNLSDANGGSLVDGIRKYSSVSVSGNCPYKWYCGGCSGPDNDTCNGHNCSASYVYQNSDDWSFTITNDADYASNKTFTWAWVQTDQKDYSGNGLSESGGTGTSTPNGEIILQRTINDTVTLYPGKNGGNESKLQEMGLRAPSYTPAKARKDGATDQPTRKTWYETFTTNWQFHNANTPTAYFSPSCGHGGTDTDSHTNTGNEATLNETYSKANNTEIYALWGRANAGLLEPNETSNLSSAKWVFNNLNFIPRKEHLKTSEIQFYPYYKMKFVSEINGAEQDAYLTSENLSKLLNVQRVDTSISANGNTSTGNSLYLDSTQSL